LGAGVEKYPAFRARYFTDYSTLCHDSACIIIPPPKRILAEKSAENTEQFIELGASGITPAKAAQELGIAHNTASNWQTDFQEEIAATKAIKLEELIDKNRMTKEKRIELFGERLEAIQKELAKRDLSDVSTPKLFEMLIKCSKALEAETDIPAFMSEEEIENIKRDQKILNDSFERHRINEENRFY
jgi:hypothetical protein